MKFQTFSPKHAIMFAILSIASFCPTSAQHYRGFADIEGAFPISNSSGASFTNSMCTTSLGLSTTHGVQLSESLFVGGGVGVNQIAADELFSDTYSRYSFPIYLQARYDFKSISKTNFFIACKLGYQFFEGLDEYRSGLKLNSTFAVKEPSAYDEFDEPSDEFYIRNQNNTCWFQNSFYFEPSVGLRVRLSSKIGLNIAVFYSPIRMKMLSYEYYLDSDYHSSGENPYYEENIANIIANGGNKKFTVHKIGLSVGIDF